MVKTLSQILNDIGAYVDQDITIPTNTTDLNSRVNFVNQALQEWGNAYQWKQLRVSSVVTFALSGVSVGLSPNFKKLMSPIVDVSTTNNTRYVEIRPEDKYIKTSADNYVYIMGDDSAGRYIKLNPPMASGASLTYYYQSFPSSMATLQDVCVCPHPEYVTKRAIGYILEARSDSRFPTVKADADTLLQRMIEEEVTPSGGENNTLRDFYAYNGFRIGRDG